MIKNELIGRIDSKLKGGAYKAAVDKALSQESMANFKSEKIELKNKSGK